MPVVRRGDEPKSEAKVTRKPIVSIRKPIPKKLDDLIALITNLLRNKKVTYLSLDAERISYDYIPEGDVDETVEWFLQNFAPKK